MKIHQSLIIFSIIFISFYNSVAQKLEIDMQQYLSRLDPIWDTTHTYFYEGAFVGNGLEGAMIYREDSSALRWDINRTDLTAPSNNPEYTRARFGVGKYILSVTGKILSSSMRIDLWNGLVKGKLLTTKGKVEFISYVHHQSRVMVTEIEETGENVSFLYKPEQAKVIKDYQWTEASATFEYPAEPIQFTQQNGVQLYKQTFTNEKSSYEVGYIELKKAGKRIFLSNISCKVPFSTDTTAAFTRLKAAEEVGAEALLSTHKAWWHRFYASSFVNLPDARLASFYWIQRYKLGSSLRADGPMLDLMGPWYAYTPWPAIWWNLNVQLTYSPLYALNELKLGETLYKTLDKNTPNLIANVPEPFRHNAAGIGRVTTYDLKGEVNLLNSKFPYYDKEPGNLQWVMYNYMQQYRYSLDDSMLRYRIHPLLKRSTNLYLNILTKDKTGKYHLPETFSPEYALTKDANFDLSLLKWGCKTLLFIGNKLNLHDTLATVWKDVMDNLTPFPTDNTGLRIGADTSLATSHRHFSHLLMIYPLRLLSWDNAIDRPLIQTSIDHWLGLKGGHAGYTYTAAAGMNAAMGRGDSAMKYLNIFLDNLPVSTLYREAGPVIETPYSAVTSIHEMILQSHDGFIKVFPAAPAQWADAAFYKLRAENAFLVSALRKEGTTQWITIESLKGAVCKVKIDRALDKIKLIGNRKFTYKKLDNNIIALDLKKGETVTISTLEKIPPIVMTPLVGKQNHYGMKFKKQ